MTSKPPQVRLQSMPDPLAAFEQAGGRLFKAGSRWVARLRDLQEVGQTDKEAAEKILDRLKHT